MILYFGESWSGRVIPFLVLGILILTHLCEPAAKAKGKGKAKSRGRAAAALNQNCAVGQLYHNDTEGCHEVDTKGPCLEQMKFYADPEAEGFGDCDCDRASVCPEQSPNIYWPDEDRCYTAFEIGPCEKTEWLVLNASGDPECQKNPCLTKAITLAPPERIDEGLTDVPNVTMTEYNTANAEIEPGKSVEHYDDGICQCLVIKKPVEGTSISADNCVCVESQYKVNSGSCKKSNISLFFVILASSLLFGTFSSDSPQLKMSTFRYT